MNWLRKKPSDRDERRVKIYVSPRTGAHRIDADEFIRTDAFKEFNQKLEAEYAHLKQE